MTTETAQAAQRQLAPTRAPLEIKPSLKAWALTWNREDPVPADLALSLPNALEAVRGAMVPAGARHWAVFLKQLLDFVDRYRLQPPGAGNRSADEIARDAKGLAGDYQAALGYLPPDLLAKAFETIRATYSNGFRPPLPAEIGATVEAEFLARAHLRSQLTLAIGHSQP